MILLRQTLRNDLEQFLRVLLGLAYSRVERMLQYVDELPSRYRLLVDWALVQPIYHRFQSLCDFPTL